MPAKNIIKSYDENGFYHIYNRGVEKRNVFIDEQDFKVFLSYLKSYLSPIADQEGKTSPSRKLKNYSESIDLICYCLMPNHFHLLIRQYTQEAIIGFMQSISTRYSMFFNRKYNRVGGLFQSAYRAVEVISEEQLVYLTRYIHRNPGPSRSHLEDALNYPYSSVDNFLSLSKQNWLKHDIVTKLFSNSVKRLSYLSFLCDTDESDDMDDYYLDNE